MLDSLKFVKGAVALKDFTPTLTHFHVANGMVKGFNGTIALCSPIALDLVVSPKAKPFVKAIETCKAVIAIHLTDGGRLLIKSGKFKAFVECDQEEYPTLEPEGELVPMGGTLLSTLKQLAPFMGVDASRPWSAGILLRNASAYATNNVLLIEKWIGFNFPVSVNIPSSAVIELLRIGKEPESVQISDSSITFHYGENKWLRSQLLSTEWPDISKILDMADISAMEPINPAVYEAINDLKPFLHDGKVIMRPGSLSSHGPEQPDGAIIEVEGFTASGSFFDKYFLLLEPVANTINLSAYPAPCAFFGDNLRGVIIGMRI